MSLHQRLIKKLTVLNEIAETLNQAVDVESALQEVLVRLVELIELETGWIFLRDPSAKNRWAGRGYRLVARHNLPSALAPGKARAWKGECECQKMCNSGDLARPYKKVHCTRLLNAGGDRRSLKMHASTPLCSGERVLGILNVAGSDWSTFDQEMLTLLTNAGSQMGIALERARLIDMLQEQRIHEQAALLELSNQLLSRLDPDELMNHLVEEVQRLLEVDACTLFLPDQDPTYLAFRAASGWQQDPVASQRRVPANEISGPGLAMKTQQPVLVEDLRRNAAAPWMPVWLRREGFRGHVVMPLIAEGRSIGALSINTRYPRRLDQDRLRFLQLLANQAAIAIEKVRLHQEALARQRMVQELVVARQIQLSLLPKSLPVVPGWDFSAFYRPARQVGGDFYDFFDLSAKLPQWGIVIADVTDKGVPSALFMTLCRTVIRTVAFTGRNPASTLMRANRLIRQDSQSDLFLTAFYAKLDTQHNRLIYCNAGHNPPLWFKAASGEFEELFTGGIVLGAFDDIELEEKRLDVDPGDVLVFYTDGATEVIDAQEEEFGEDRLQAVIVANVGASARDMVKAIVDAVDGFASDASYFDDLTLVIAKRCPV